MFQRKELEQLRLRREQLVLQSNANRQRLARDWQRVQSPESWMDEFFGLAGRHPLSTAALAMAAGLLATKILRKPWRVMNGIGQLGKLVPLILSLWRLYRTKKRPSSSSP